jgi:gentisate 1,2-dioxygenase
VKPVINKEQLTAAWPLAGAILETLKTHDAKAAMTGVAMALVFAADAAGETPLESIFQMMRLIRKGLVAQQRKLEDARARGEAPSAASGLVTPAQGRIVLP